MEKPVEIKKQKLDNSVIKRIYWWLCLTIFGLAIFWSIQVFYWQFPIIIVMFLWAFNLANKFK
jgi:hypothetical protein